MNASAARFLQPRAPQRARALGGLPEFNPARLLAGLTLLAATILAVPSRAQSSSSFESEIRSFELADQRNPPPAYPILFVGSSTIRGWSDLAAAFPEYDVLNRGFGGSQLSDVLYFFDRVVLAYHPPVILLYEGDNDLAAGKTVDQVFNDWVTFAHRVRNKLPDTTLAFISVKPSPSRVQYLQRQAELNERVRQHAAGDPHLAFIDVFHPMLDTSGQPRPEWFVSDLLHLNPAGYDLWSSILSPWIDDWSADSPFPARHPASGEVLIDFGADTRLSAQANPDPGEHWNNLTPSVAASSAGRLASLVTTAGVPTTVGLSMVSRFNGANENGTLASLQFPASATRDSLFGNTEAFSGLSNIFPAFALTGLDPSTPCNLTFYASRLGVSDNRETLYTVSGASTAEAILDPANNLEETVSIDSALPAADGRLTIALSPGPQNNNANHFTYLGVLRVSVGTAGPVFLIDAGASGSPTTVETPPPAIHWNDVPASLATRDDAPITQPLITTNGTVSSVRLQILSRFNGANENGTTTSTLFPSSATADSLFGNTELFNGLSDITPRLRILGLDPSASCALTFYASRTGVSDRRDTRYLVTGLSTSSADLDSANNIETAATLDALSPDSQGALDIALVPGPANNNANHFTYLGVLRLRWDVPAPAPRPRFQFPSIVGEHFRLRLTGRIGRAYSLQSSADLKTWIDLGRYVLSSPTEIIDVPATPRSAFFRAME